MNDRIRNPFELVTASKLTATEAVELWCDDKRLDRVIGRETCFIHGHRGTGKSMLFRVLQRDCQEILRPERRPSFLAIYFPVRDSEFLVEELNHFQLDLQRYIICESQLSLLIVKQLLLIIRERPEVVPDEHRTRFVDLTTKRITAAYRFSDASPPPFEREELADVVLDVIDVIDDECQRLRHFICSRLYKGASPYDGPLFLYDTLLGPIADFFSDSVKVCLYFLIDDGDELPTSHKVILNTWIARRRKSAAFKVSTMYGYRTWNTRSGSAIQQSHDFIQYDIASRYLEAKGESYIELLRDICRKRLVQAGVTTEHGEDADPIAFFPRHEDQEAEMKKVEARLMQEYTAIYKGRAVRDNVYRHTTSEYMRALNRKRALGSFCYAGFRTLAVLSGGLVRDFIVCAQKMFDDASRRNRGRVLQYISPSIQNTAVRAHADRLLQEVGESQQKRTGQVDDWANIARLIEGLGALFKQKMLSEDSERRVFSFAFQSPPSTKLHGMLSLAISEGYFMKGHISKKEGTGRRALYVLTRRLAPCFSLDVSSYSGYLSCRPEDIEKLTSVGARVKWADVETAQMELFAAEGEGDERYRWVEPDNVEIW